MQLHCRLDLEGLLVQEHLRRGISRAFWGRTRQSWRRLFLSVRSYSEARAGSHPTQCSCSWQWKHPRGLDRLYPQHLKVLGSLAGGCQPKIGRLMMFPYTEIVESGQVSQMWWLPGLPATLVALIWHGTRTCISSSARRWQTPTLDSSHSCSIILAGCAHNCQNLGSKIVGIMYPSNTLREQ